MPRQKVSALVPTFNSSETLHRALASLSWVDEILVVDSFSTDNTLEIANQHGAGILSHEYINSATQKNWAVVHCSCDWVLQVDSDELVTPELKEELIHALETVPEDVDAFRMPRINLFIGKRLKFGGSYPDYQTRLFRKKCGKWQDREVHAHIQVPGTIRTLNAPLVHDDWPTLSKMLGRLDRYTRYEADELRKRGQGFVWSDLVLRPIVVFIVLYLWRQAFRDGWRGLVFAVYMAVYVFMTRAKLWEMEVLGIERSPKA